VIRARLLLFIPLPLALWAIPVLQELRETVTAANQLVAEIDFRFKTGAPAGELLARLDTVIATLAQQATGVAELPDDLKNEITRLFSLVQTAIATGNEWLALTGPELASQHLRHRLHRVYGVP
jgi:hypothetical protein